MARPKKNTIQLVCRIDFDLISKLKLINPSLVTRDTATGQFKFRYGALGRYVQRLISEDIAKREKLMQDDVLGKFMT